MHDRFHTMSCLLHPWNYVNNIFLRKRSLELKQCGAKLVMKRYPLPQKQKLLPNNGTTWIDFRGNFRFHFLATSSLKHGRTSNVYPGSFNRIYLAISVLVTIILGCSVVTQEIKYLSLGRFRGNRTVLTLHMEVVTHQHPALTRISSACLLLPRPVQGYCLSYDLYEFTAKRSPFSAVRLGRSHQLKVEKTHAILL